MIRLLRVRRELRSMQWWLKYTRTDKDNTSRRGRRRRRGHTHMYILSWSIYLSTYIRRLCIWCNYSIVASTMSTSRNSRPFITAPSVRFKSMTLDEDCRAPSLSLSLSFSLPTWPRVEKKNQKNKWRIERWMDGAKKVEKKIPIFIHSFFHTFMHVPYS